MLKSQKIFFFIFDANIQNFIQSSVENCVLAANQSVDCCGTTLFTIGLNSAKVWNMGFNWPAFGVHKKYPNDVKIFWWQDPALANRTRVPREASASTVRVVHSWAGTTVDLPGHRTIGTPGCSAQNPPKHRATSPGPRSAAAVITAPPLGTAPQGVSISYLNFSFYLVDTDNAITIFYKGYCFYFC